MRDDEILAPLNFAKIWAHHRHLARAAEILRVLHGLPDWEHLGVYGPTDDWGVVWIYGHAPTERVWLFGLTPHFRSGRQVAAGDSDRYIRPCSAERVPGGRATRPR